MALHYTPIRVFALWNFTPRTGHRRFSTSRKINTAHSRIDKRVDVIAKSRAAFSPTNSEGDDPDSPGE
jgi:hypothetical protein